MAKNRFKVGQLVEVKISDDADRYSKYKGDIGLVYALSKENKPDDEEIDTLSIVYFMQHRAFEELFEFRLIPYE